MNREDEEYDYYDKVRHQFPEELEKYFSTISYENQMLLRKRNKNYNRLAEDSLITSMTMGNSDPLAVSRHLRNRHKKESKYGSSGS
jgi:hypothetical protein